MLHDASCSHSSRHVALHHRWILAHSKPSRPPRKNPVTRDVVLGFQTYAKSANAITGLRTEYRHPCLKNSALGAAEALDVVVALARYKLAVADVAQEHHRRNHHRP